MLLLLFAYAFVLLLIEVYGNYLFMIPVLPLQLLRLTFITASAVVVVPSLPFLFTFRASCLYRARQRLFSKPFLKSSSTKLTPAEIFVFNTSYIPWYLFSVVGLLSMIIFAGQEGLCLLQRKYQGQRHLDRPVQGPPALPAYFPASVIFEYFQLTSVVSVLARLPAGALSSSVGSGLVHFFSVGVSSPKEGVGFSIAFIKLVPWRVPRSNRLF